MYFLTLLTVAFAWIHKEASIKGYNDVTCCYGHYDVKINQTGWNELVVVSSDKCSNEDQAFCIGYFEGLATAEDIDIAWNNYRFNHWIDGEPPSDIKVLMRKQHNFWEKRTFDETWRRQYIIKNQFEGLYEGYRDAGGNMTMDDMYIWYNSGDLYDINDFADYSVNSPSAMRERYGRMNIHSCSAFIKNFNDTVYFAHNTWDHYAEMFRVYKVYETHFGEKRTIAMTSYPGIFASIDDFYSVRTELSTYFVTETTNNVYDVQIYEGVVNRLLYQQRIMQALLFETSVKGMAESVCTLNSGTYNNQWMFFDAGRWKSGERTEILYITETMPGLCKTHDVTSSLTEGNKYWVSYNVPYDREIYNKSGLEEYLRGIKCDAYTMARRRQIFDRDMHKVVDLESAKDLIRSNDFEKDPLATYTSECKYDFNSTEEKNPCYAISARKDLDEEHFELYGAKDAKVMSTENLDVMHIINGPTYDVQPVFDFTEIEGYEFYVEGIPMRYDFDWMEMETIRKSINGASVIIVNNLVAMLFAVLFL